MKTLFILALLSNSNITVIEDLSYAKYDSFEACSKNITQPFLNSYSTFIKKEYNSDFIVLCVNEDDDTFFNTVGYLNSTKKKSLPR